MIKTLVMYYDESRAAIAQVARPSVEEFCRTNGYDLHLNLVPAFPDAMTAMFYKPRLIDQYLWQCERLIYTDVDILFRPGAVDQELFKTDLNVSQDFNGLCVGFMALANTQETCKIIRVWSELGPIKAAQQHDQTTFKWLVENIPWITQITSLISMDLVSNPRHPVSGAVAHHFWCQYSDREWMANNMRNYQFGPVLPAKV